MKRAAITGIAGQDGTYLARGLLRRGYEVHGLLQFPFDREEPVLRRRYPPEQFAAVRWSTGSLEDPFSLVRFLKSSQPDEIYHLAGLTDSRQSFLVPEESVLSITLGTLRLLEAARELCPSARMFLASSAEVFGEPAETPQSETTLMKPVTPYGIAKLAADQFGRLHRDKYSQFVSVGILYNHESPLRPPNYLSRRVSLGVAAIKRGAAKELQLGDLSAERIGATRATSLTRCGFPCRHRSPATTSSLPASSARWKTSSPLPSAPPDSTGASSSRPPPARTISNKSPAACAATRAKRRANLAGNGRGISTPWLLILCEPRWKIVPSWTARIHWRSQKESDPLPHSRLRTAALGLKFDHDESCRTFTRTVTQRAPLAIVCGGLSCIGRGGIDPQKHRTAVWVRLHENVKISLPLLSRHALGAPSPSGFASGFPVTLRATDHMKTPNRNLIWQLSEALRTISRTTTHAPPNW